MKIPASILGLMLLASAVAPAQNGPMRRGPDGPYMDPFDVMQLYMHSLDAQWPSYNVPSRQGGSGAAAATVSVQQLQHKIPKLASKEYKKGRDAYGKSNMPLAMEHFQNAIGIDPDFSEAHNDLGVVLAKLDHLEQSAAEFQKAVDLVPNHNMAVGNLAIALFVLERYKEVCLVARRALQIDPSVTYIRYILGLSLIAEHGDKKEALENLQRAASKFPEAHVAASNVLARIGRREDAVRELEEYLRSATIDTARQQQVEARLAELRQ